MYKKYIFLLIAIISLSIVNRTYAEDPKSTKLMTSYLKLADGSKHIKATLLTVEEKGKSPLESATLKISSMNGEDPVDLGTIVTNYKGLAVFMIPKTATLSKDKDGNYNFMVQYEGDKSHSASQASLTIKDVVLELIVDEKDTAKNVKALVYEMDDKGIKKLVSDVDVEFDIKRLFCNYGFATVKTDSSGGCSAVFPAKMPGDSTGDILILARLVDNEIYGNVESSHLVKWGVPVLPTMHHKRGLGDTDAPLWMVYTLIVLLSAVWLHFMYIIYSILRINYLGKKMLKENAVSQ